MAKSSERIKARELRQQGISVGEIAKTLNVSKSTVSLWVRDIILSIEQLEKLQQRSLEGRERGQLLGALAQKRKRLELIEKERQNGWRLLSMISDREFFVAGLALYAGEGNKKTRAVRFSNSDPMIIKFMIKWFKKFFDVKNDDFHCFIGINAIHRSREGIVKKYWSEITDIPLNSFWKTSFKKTVSKKIYINFNEHYGTLDVRILHPAPIFYKMLGLIDGLLNSTIDDKKV
ncbi:helix-turn-helix domain-containing protein [Candidatus Gottesmanbacteria bacterium]|nr:helix-turn-helix domain-containing protein [Candidatus Gottesmanbacteria bacterium]